MRKPESYLQFVYVVPHRFVRRGVPGPMTRRYFQTARDALAFVSELLQIDPADACIFTVSRREVGSWEHLVVRDLEAAAAEEGGQS